MNTNNAHSRAARAVKTDPVLVFLHIPKTAGLSFRRLLLDRYGQEGVAEVNSWDDYQGFLKSVDPARLGAVLGHLPYGIHEKLGGRPTNYFTILRHPVARFVSDYHYIIASPDHPWRRRFDSEQLMLEDFVEASEEDYYIAFNSMTRRLCSYDLDYAYTPQIKVHKHWWETHLTLTRSDLSEAMANLKHRIKHFGIFEDMNATLSYFCALVDLPSGVRLGRENISPLSTPLTSIPEALYAWVVQRNILDMELYYWAVDEFRRKVRSARLGGL